MDFIYFIQGNGNAVIYYTTNDQDPRLPGGAVNSNAISIPFGML
jgi:hypothetical protein